MNKFIRFSQVVLIVAGCALFIVPPSFFPSYYKPTLMGLVALAYCFLIQLPVFIFRIPENADASAMKEKVSSRGQLQAALSLGFLLSGLGSLGLWGLYRVGIPYDKIVHFTFSALLTVSGAYVFQAWYGWSLKKTAIVLALVIGVSGIAWEFTEFFSDRWLHFGYFGQLFDGDSLFDIFTNLSGAGVGIIAWRQWSDNKLKHIGEDRGV